MYKTLTHAKKTVNGNTPPKKLNQGMTNNFKNYQKKKKKTKITFVTTVRQDKQLCLRTALISM